MLRKLLGFPQKEYTILLPINIMCDKLPSQTLVFGHVSYRSKPIHSKL